MMAAAGTMAGCGGTTSNGNSDMSKGSMDMAMAAPPCSNGVLCTNSTIADQTMELNAATSGLTFNVLANPGYSGMVTVKVDQSSIMNLSGGKPPDVNIVAVPGQFPLTGGQGPMSVTLNLTTTTLAAAFTAQPITLTVADSADPTKNFTMTFKLTVSPVLTITFMGAGTPGNLHTWSTDNGNTINFSVRSRPIVAGMGGTTFNFLNKDTNSHIIHGDNPITHQPVGGTGTAPNTMYTVPNVNVPMAANTAGFYCHTHNTTGSNPVGTRFVTAVP